MKKTVCLMLCLSFLTVCPAGCDDFVIRGLDSYSGGHTMFATDDFLPNQERFWETHKYIEGDYYFSSESTGWLFSNLKEVALLYLKFDETNYAEVKKFVLEHIAVEEERTYSYNSYYFCEDMSDYYEESSYRFPFHFTLTGYHDEKKIIIFLGIYHYPTSNDPSEQAQNELANNGNIEPFLKEYFPMYDFSK